MRGTTWVLLSVGLLLGGLLTCANTGPGSLPGLEGTALAVPSELFANEPGNPADLKPREREEFVLPPRDSMRVGLEVLVDGRPLRTINHEGRIFVPVPKLGTEYEIRVWSNGPRRVTAIVSVDGLSVMDGKPASAEQPGYIVAPRGDIVIKGWRRDRESVAAFSFEERDKSYANRVGHPENIGVIGLITIEESGVRPRPLPLEKKDSPIALRGSGDVGGTGTGSGRDVDSPVYSVPFVRGTNQSRITLYYDTAEALRKAGVPVDGPSPVPFPRDEK
jgi:hypothetical protein